jgi:hypothetical protein
MKIAVSGYIGPGMRVYDTVAETDRAREAIKNAGWWWRFRDLIAHGLFWLGMRIQPKI